MKLLTVSYEILTGEINFLQWKSFLLGRQCFNYNFICQFKGGNAGGDLETIARECFRAFDGANQEARRDIARLLGTLIAYTQQVAILQILLRYSSLAVYTGYL